MRQDDVDFVDEGLSELKRELNRIDPPMWQSKYPVECIESLEPRAAAKTRIKMNSWIPFGVAASFTLLATGVLNWFSMEEKIIEENQMMVSGYTVTRALSPVQVHSLSRGAELFYLESRTVQDQSGLTKAVYVYLPN